MPLCKPYKGYHTNILDLQTLPRLNFNVILTEKSGDTYRHKKVNPRNDLNSVLEQKTYNRREGERERERERARDRERDPLCN